MPEKSVEIWEKTVTIPTYLTGEPNKNPMFLEKRVYQGSSGAVYPHQVIDKIHDEKVDKEYLVVFLENEYLKVMVMPSLGGRIQMAYDKQNNYHFVYYNHVIKPALVGLTGPWLSGGIEFNWPQHHRPSTFLPVDYTIEAHDDGSKTLWVSEVELMFRTKGMAGFTLHPERASLEIQGRIYNRTDSAQTFLWWANPALAVNDDYQSVFPPDVYAVMDHGKRDVSRFPIARGTYYKMDYSRGVDISRYKNIKVPTSYMVHQSQYNFIGGYDHGRHAGMLHVADRHISPGKKQWVWGSGDFGQAWDRNLTDEDGPYAELMTGVFTDNQPDFSWLQPYEEKTFTQHFMPYKNIGLVKNADENRALSLDLNGDDISAGLYVCSKHDDVTLILSANGKILVEERLSLSPGESRILKAKLPENCKEHHLELKLLARGKMLISYVPEESTMKPLPDAMQAALEPEEISSLEDLFLTGMHLEQYRHATRRAEDYYLEALKRDESDIRCNNAYGKLLMKRCRFEEAEKHFRKAVTKLIRRNPNPFDGEPHYNLGLALLYQEKTESAYSAFYKSIWNDAFKSPGYFHLAVICCQNKEWDKAALFLDQSLINNFHNHKARNLLATVNRMAGKNEDALNCCELTLSLDPCDWGALYENVKLSQESLDEFLKLMRDEDNNYLELSLDYSLAGFFEDALDILEIALKRKDPDNCSPLLRYHRAWLLMKMNDSTYKKAFQDAANLSPEGCFPSKKESLKVLMQAAKHNPSDSNTHYYLGNFHYALRNYDLAIRHWGKSIEKNDSFSTPYRNLALALMNTRGDSKGCKKYLEKAFELDTSDSRVLFELDQLYKILNTPLTDRLTFLEKHDTAVSDRDDLFLEYIALLNDTGQYESALGKITRRQFHPWEGGEGKVPREYKRALSGLAVQAIKRGAHAEALDLLEQCRTYPHTLGEGKLYGTLENDIDFLSGVACKRIGDCEKAELYFRKASQGNSHPVSAMFYNDQPPHMIFFQALAFRALGEEGESCKRFNTLIEYGVDHINDDVTIDYFAVSLPDFLVFDVDLNRKNRIHCLFMLALGYMGLNDMDVSNKYRDEILGMENYHIVGGVLDLAM